MSGKLSTIMKKRTIEFKDETYVYIFFFEKLYESN